MISPFLYWRMTMPPSLRLRNSPLIPAKIGICFISSAVSGAPGIRGCTPAE